MDHKITAEHRRLEASGQRKEHWKRWGPYLAERAWGTVREDYSKHGTAWEYLPHDHARSVAYRWNEDGIAGISDRHQRICFSIALWNGRDPILKERLFGLTGNEGNHGEDVKENYYYLDSTPTHSYMKYLYKYPQAQFPYTQLTEENRKRGRADPEFELDETGVFDENKYFDVLVEYAKASVEDILIRVTISNRGPDHATIHLLPHIWFRNRWAWNRDEPKPGLRRCGSGDAVIELREPEYGKRWLTFEGNPPLLFTENETNYSRVHKAANASPYVKDSIGRAVIHGDRNAVNPEHTGTKAAAWYVLDLAPGETRQVRCRFSDLVSTPTNLGEGFEKVFSSREAEADDFYSTVIPDHMSADARHVMRQSFAGLMWSKQYYHYVVEEWLNGDPTMPKPPANRKHGRNHEWTHVFSADVISMPDKWEYPWFAAWDLAFHCVPIALIDSDFAKDQLMLMTREWYMHPNGQLPAYEWAFGDVNPPVHAWAAYRVYKIEKKRHGKGDRSFLQRIFHKLVLNFTWWVNRKDKEGKNVFQGGFLGLDNIGVFDRSSPLPTGGYIEQADGTGWMAMYSLNLLAIAM
ncbi:MAG: glucosidase, partial [Bryobacteraceae bacterium]|nr:glucosidase [Bryobacteraceae bacterium]